MYMKIMVGNRNRRRYTSISGIGIIYRSIRINLGIRCLGLRSLIVVITRIRGKMMINVE